MVSVLSYFETSLEQFLRPILTDRTVPTLETLGRKTGLHAIKGRQLKWLQQGMVSRTRINAHIGKFSQKAFLIVFANYRLRVTGGPRLERDTEAEMGRPGLTVPTWNVLDKADTAKRVNILERTTEMIRIEETEHEFLLYIPASQKERAKAIRPREWDWKRVCWVYPRNSLVYCALRAEFWERPCCEICHCTTKVRR